MKTSTRCALILGCLVLVLGLPMAPAAHADTVLVGAPTAFVTYYNMHVTGGTPARLAAQFSLSSADAVSTINATFIDFDNSTGLSLSLATSLTGPAIKTFNFTTNNLLSDPFSFNLNQTLAAGTYYLILAGTGSIVDPTGWVVSNDALTQTAGTVANGLWFSTDAGTTWTFDSAPASPPPVFTVDGAEVTTAPEPGSLLLLGCGLLLLGTVALRRA